MDCTKTVIANLVIKLVITEKRTTNNHKNTVLQLFLEYFNSMTPKRAFISCFYCEMYVFEKNFNIILFC